jgi:hypothetical protein
MLFEMFSQLDNKMHNISNNVKFADPSCGSVCES